MEISRIFFVSSFRLSSEVAIQTQQIQLRSLSLSKKLKFQPLPFAWPCARFLDIRILRIQTQSQAPRMKIAEALRSLFEQENFELITSYCNEWTINCAIDWFFLWFVENSSFCPKTLRFPKPIAKKCEFFVFFSD